MDDYHGIVINLSQKDRRVLSGLDIIGRKSTLLNLVVLYKVRIAPENIDQVIHRLQANMRTGFYGFIRAFYFHFYCNDELIVVFKNKTFRVTPDPGTWREVVAYGRSLGIPLKQLDFSHVVFLTRLTDHVTSVYKIRENGNTG